MCARGASNSTFRLGLVAVATTIVVVACDRVNLTAPTGSTVTISVDRSVVPLNGQATVTAVITEAAGTPVHNGTSVTFQTTVGSLNPPTAETVNGVATTTFLAGQTSGVATIHAYSGGARTGSGNSSSGGATIRVGTAAASGTISVSATPSSVSQSGGTVTISALVFDEQSNPLPGIPVQFVSSTGSLSPTTAVTDANGIARTQLTTTSTATVDAFAGAAKGNVRVEASTAPTVTISALSPTTPVVGQPVTFSVTTSSGNSSAPRQVQTLEVNFGDGRSETRSNVTGEAAFTHTYGREGGYTITARAVDVAGNSGNASRAVIVARSTAPTVTLDISPNPADVNQIVGFSVTTSAPAGTQQPVESVRVFINGELAYSTTGSSGAFTRGFSGTGTYTVIAEALDSAGNIGRTQKFLIVEP
jgi:hypothetical protein